MLITIITHLKLTFIDIRFVLWILSSSGGGKRPCLLMLFVDPDSHCVFRTSLDFLFSVQPCSRAWELFYIPHIFCVTQKHLQRFLPSHFPFSSGPQTCSQRSFSQLWKSVCHLLQHLAVSGARGGHASISLWPCPYVLKSLSVSIEELFSLYISLVS